MGALFDLQEDGSSTPAWPTPPTMLWRKNCRPEGGVPACSTPFGQDANLQWPC